MRSDFRAPWALAFALCCAVTGEAWATPGEESAPAPTASEEKPWERGVSAETQAQARRLFREGTALLNDAAFAPAADAFRKALELWGHPAIHYNMVIAQLNLDRPLEARAHLLQVLAFGPEAIGPEKFESARTYLTLVEKQLARVRVSCAVEGAQVSMDGEPLLVAPEVFENFVLPGPHALVAKKEGYLTSEQSENLPSGTLTEVTLQLHTAEELTEYRRRWATWMPWTVFGAGIAVAAVGGGLHALGISKVDDFDEQAKANGWSGVATTQEQRDLRREGQNLQKGAIALYSVGGAALAAGIALLVLNRPQPYLMGQPLDAKGEAEPATVDLSPMLGADATGLSATLRF